MTKLREPLTAHDALSTIIGGIGLEEAARIAARTQRTVQNWSDPGTPECAPIDVAAALDRAYVAAGGDHAPLASWYRSQVDFPAIDGGAIDRLKAAASVVKESGEAGAAQIIAARPGASRADKAIAVRETKQAIGAMTASLPALEADAETAA